VSCSCWVCRSCQNWQSYMKLPTFCLLNEFLPGFFFFFPLLNWWRPTGLNLERTRFSIYEYITIWFKILLFVYEHYKNSCNLPCVYSSCYCSHVSSWQRGYLYMKNEWLRVLIGLAIRVHGSSSCQPVWPDYINGSNTKPTRLLIGLWHATRTQPD